MNQVELAAIKERREKASVPVDMANEVNLLVRPELVESQEDIPSLIATLERAVGIVEKVADVRPWNVRGWCKFGCGAYEGVSEHDTEDCPYRLATEFMSEWKR